IFYLAEDGIRDFHVTGVQTCALPISFAGIPHLDTHPLALPTATQEDLPPFTEFQRVGQQIAQDARDQFRVGEHDAARRDEPEVRSEERRVWTDSRAWAES